MTPLGEYFLLCPEVIAKIGLCLQANKNFSKFRQKFQQQPQITSRKVKFPTEDSEQDISLDWVRYIEPVK